jgi:hypothetical protein
VRIASEDECKFTVIKSQDAYRPSVGSALAYSVCGREKLDAFFGECKGVLTKFARGGIFEKRGLVPSSATAWRNANAKRGNESMSERPK